MTTDTKPSEKPQCEDRLLLWKRIGDFACAIQCCLPRGHDGEYHEARIEGERTVDMRWSLTYSQEQLRALQARYTIPTPTDLLDAPPSRKTSPQRRDKASGGVQGRV